MKYLHPRFDEWDWSKSQMEREMVDNGHDVTKPFVPEPLIRYFSRQKAPLPDVSFEDYCRWRAAMEAYYAPEKRKSPGQVIPFRPRNVT